MRVRDQRRLQQYQRAHPDADASLRTWWVVVSAADWKRWTDVRQTINSADRFGECVIFNIKGNAYRLVCRINYDLALVDMAWFGTHKEYDRGGRKRGC